MPTLERSGRPFERVQSGPRGTRYSRAFRTANLYTADPEDRYHDAGIGSRSSRRVAHSTGWSFEHHVKTRVHTHLGPSSACRPITGLTRFLAYHPSLRYLADRDEPPQRDQQLASQSHDCNRRLFAGGDPCPIPLYQRTIRLIYPAHTIIRNFFGSMTRKLSETSSQ